MLQIPQEPQAGDMLNAAFARQVVRCLRALVPSGGPGITVATTPFGTTYRVGDSNLAGFIPPHPFKVLDASTASAAKVRVVFGQLNNITPTIGGTALDADPEDPPLLTVVTGVVYLAAVLDVDGVVTSTSIHNAAELPETDATHAYLTLATVTVASSAVTAISQSVTHSLALRRCGVSDMHFWGL